MPPDDVADVRVAQLRGDVGREAFADGEDRLVEVEDDAGRTRVQAVGFTSDDDRGDDEDDQAAAATTMRMVTAPPLGDSRS